MYVKNGTRIDSPFGSFPNNYVDSHGTQYPGTSVLQRPDVLLAEGITQQTDPIPQDANFYTNTLLPQSPFIQSAYKPLADCISAKLLLLEAYGAQKTYAGHIVNGIKYDTDTTSQHNLNSAYNLANTASSPASFSWWFSYGWVTLTKAQILADAPIVGAWVEANYAAMGTHYAAISALTSQAAVIAYDFTTGWPV